MDTVDAVLMGLGLSLAFVVASWPHAKHSRKPGWKAGWYRGGMR